MQVGDGEARFLNDRQNITDKSGLDGVWLYHATSAIFELGGVRQLALLFRREKELQLLQKHAFC